jgi:peptide/nickel transport system permease protein
VSSFLQGDMGQSLQYDSPASTLIFDSMVRSLKLALEAFVIVVPLSILGGVWAALRFGRPADRIITTASLSIAVVPEFVTASVLLLVFGIWLGWLPITAQYPDGAGPLTQVRYLLLPAIALALVLFGYIARMARAGTIEALDSDYTRTAYLKGLDRQTVVRRHVLRNALLPTIAVVATQVGYLIGGLIIIEVLFNYQGVGLLIYNAAKSKDFIVLQSGVLLVGIVYLVATLVADILYSLLNPRIRYATAQ